MDAGNGEGRKPLRQRADELHAVLVELEHPSGNDRQDDCHENARDLREDSLEHEDESNADDADRERCAHRLAVPDPVDEASRLGDEAVRIDREPEQLRQLAHENREGEAVHVADHRRLRQQVRDESELEDPAEHRDRPDEQREHRGERDGPLRIAVRPDERQDRRRDHRPEGRVGAEHEDARRAEDGIPRQAEDRRVQAGDRRQAGELGIRHALRNEQCDEDEPCDEILPQPGGPVLGKKSCSWKC